MPRLTIVLPVYNHAQYVEQTLLSLLAQDFKDFRIVAVDDGSTDESLGILDRYGAQIDIVRGSHRGPAAARNLALRASDSEFVAFMDADDFCTSDRLRLSMEKIESEGLDFVASALSFIDSSGKPLPGLWRCPPHGSSCYWGALIERNWIGTPSVLLRRNVFEDSGLFDEGFTHAEDYDLWLRIGRSHSIGYIDRPLIRCRRHSTNTSIDIESHRLFEERALQKVDRLEARQAFDKLYSTFQERDEAWIWFLLRSGKTEFSEECALALKKHPSSHPLKFAFGVFLYDCGRWTDARATFTELQDRDAAARHNAGVLAAKCADSLMAMSCFDNALKSRPDYHDAKINRTALCKNRPLRLTRRPLRENLVPMT